MDTQRPSDPVDASRVEQFMALYSSHQRRLYLYTLTLLPTSLDAEDVFQDANLVLWRKFDQYQAGTNFFRLGLQNHPLHGPEAPRESAPDGSALGPRRLSTDWPKWRSYRLSTSTNSIAKPSSTAWRG